ATLVVITDVLPLEASGDATNPVSTTGSLPIESAAGVQQTVVLTLEALTTAAQTAAAPGEAVTALLTTAGLPVEAAHDVARAAAPCRGSRLGGGDAARSTGAGTALTRGLGGPRTVTATVTAPAATVTLPTVTKDSTGHYDADVPVTMRGDWTYVWTGTGTLSA